MATETPSLGRAIALQYKLPSSDTAVNLINQRRKEEQDAIDAAKKAAQRSRELQEKYRDDLDKFNVEGIIAPLQRNAQAASAAIIDHVKKGIARNPNYNPYGDNELDVLRFDLKQITARDRISSDAYLKDVEKGVGSPKSFALQKEWTDAVGKNDKEAWDKLTGGTGVYTYGAITPTEEVEKIKVSDEKAKHADQTRQGALTTQEGAQFVPDVVKKQRFQDYRMTPTYEAEIAKLMSKGMTAEKADAYSYDDYVNVLGKKEAPIKKEGGLEINIGQGAKSGKFYYNLENPESAQAGGKSAIIFGQEGGTPLPFNSFIGKNGKEIIGRPTGKIYDIGKEKNDFEMEMLVPKTQPKGFSFDVSVITPETNPDKYEKIYVPLTTSDFNRKKFQGEYGGQDINDVYKNITKEAKTTKTKPSASKTIKRSDISTKAKASGYTAKEYEKMLIERGIKITE